MFNIGDKVKVKSTKVIELGILPAGLEDKYDYFSILKFDYLDDKFVTDNSLFAPSVFLNMPFGIGKRLIIDGKEVWGWWVYIKNLED